MGVASCLPPQVKQIESSTVLWQFRNVQSDGTDNTGFQAAVAAMHSDSLVHCTPLQRYVCGSLYL